MPMVTIPLLDKTKESLKKIPYCHAVFDKSSGEKFDNGSVWLLPDGDMYLSPISPNGDREHFNISEVIQQVDPKFKGTKTKPIRYFQTNANAIRVRCFKHQKSNIKELAIEYNADQELPNQKQINAIKNELCNGNYDSLINQITDSKSRQFFWRINAEYDIKKIDCEKAVDLLMRNFKDEKYPKRATEMLEAEAKSRRITVDQLLEKKKEAEELFAFHVGSQRKRVLLR